ncbi:MAG: phosphoglucomutase/phosphomannomutase family protein [Bacteroidetes bacterium]|nr:phosphoglucomutase/phosphomannomutase family protein [Bacteroidota bacterium]MCY4204306.1 phosphoglucomutase/phosphomannomutase family protein [Bacteroidota bacterium]
MADSLRFGTDGWRAVIGREFTFANLSRMARATVKWLKLSNPAPRVVVGHDTRFMGRLFAEHVAQEFANEGATVILASGPTPTPAISWAATRQGISAGVVITASHNPPEYSGYKIKTHFGGPATDMMTGAVEKLMEPYAPSSRRHGRELVEERNITAEYTEYLRSLFDLGSIDVRLVHDPMYGAGQGILSRLLSSKCVTEIRSEINPGFGGIAPEPIEKNLGELMESVVRQGATVGIAHDGDADRIGVVDERGDIVTSHLVMALLAAHLHKYHSLKGAIVRTFATSAILTKMGAAWGIPVETYPIGFKHVAPRFLETDVLVGGEESGGIAVAGHIPERDGIYVALVLLNMLAERQKPLTALVQELFDEFGPHAYYRSDVHTQKQPEIIADLRRMGGLRQIGGRKVNSMDLLDGFKHLMEDAWLLIRPSGTEPVLRIYAEAPTGSEAETLVHDVLTQFDLPT